METFSFAASLFWAKAFSDYCAGHSSNLSTDSTVFKHDRSWKCHGRHASENEFRVLGGVFHFPKERREERKIKEGAEALLERFNLLSKSGGWRPDFYCRAETARNRESLGRATGVLLLDEPAAGLNIRETEAMGDLILRLKEEGQTVILVEHNMHLVMGISDWVIVLHHGSKIGEGRPEEVQRDRGVVEAYLGT